MPRSPRPPSAQGGGGPPALFTSPSRHHRMVFVDPDDPSLPYWWAALIVPEEEWSLFREAMDSDVQTVKPSEVLVCYFEDGSYSVVPRTALTPFHPDKDPYLAYAKENPGFGEEEAIRLATNFWHLGEVPARFKWLRWLVNGGVETKKTVAANTPPVSNKVLSPPPAAKRVKRKPQEEPAPEESLPTKPSQGTFRQLARFVPSTRMQSLLNNKSLY